MKQQTLRSIRRWHLYIGMFFAPLLLLFAVSGAFQTYRLHEAKGWGGPPPRILVTLGMLHMDQRASEPEKRPPPATAAAPKAPTAAPAPAAARPAAPLALQLFRILAVLLSVGLVVSTLLGMVIALTMPAVRGRALLALAVGTLLPVVLAVAQ